MASSRAIRLPWLLLAYLAVLACASGPSPYTELGEPPRVAEHAHRSAELAGRMRELERLSYEQRSQLGGGVVRPGEREKLVALARGLSDSAAHIPEAGAKLSLAPAERDEFAFLAEVLARRSLAMANEAPFGSLEALYRRTEEIEQTCRHCHGRFRIPLGDALEGEDSLTSGGTRD